jgi:hypothetical protein
VLLTLALPIPQVACSVTSLFSLLATNYDLFTIRFSCAKVVNTTQLCSGNLNRIPPKIHLSNLKADSSCHSYHKSLHCSSSAKTLESKHSSRPPVPSSQPHARNCPRRYRSVRHSRRQRDQIIAMLSPDSRRGRGAAV